MRDATYNNESGKQASENAPDVAEAEKIVRVQESAESFVEVYQVTLIHIEQHLNDVVSEAGTFYAQGYQPWQEALHNLVNGAPYLARNENIPDMELFCEALRVFSFKSAAHFLNDLCADIGLKTDRKWPEKFRDHIQNLIQSIEILRRNCPA